MKPALKMIGVAVFVLILIVISVYWEYSHIESSNKGLTAVRAMGTNVVVLDAQRLYDLVYKVCMAGKGF